MRWNPLSQVYPNNADEPLQALLATLQALRRPTLLAYVERSEAVTRSLESGLVALSRSGRPRCRRLRLAAKTWLFALDEWAPKDDGATEESAADLGDTARARCGDVNTIARLLP